MGEFCCRLGSAIHQERVICKTDNFFVIPTLGSLGIEGYLLIVSKKHYLGFGDIPEKEHFELNEIIDGLKKLIKQEYGKDSLIFEHGPRIGNYDSGKSIDHAHLHVVPGVEITPEWAKDMMMRLESNGKFFRVERVEGFKRARELLERDSSYLYVENLLGMQLLSEQNFHRPSQYFRKMVANQINIKNWNWRENPDYETLEKTVHKLQGKL